MSCQLPRSEGLHPYAGISILPGSVTWSSLQRVGGHSYYLKNNNTVNSDFFLSEEVKTFTSMKVIPKDSWSLQGGTG